MFLCTVFKVRAKDGDEAIMFVNDLIEQPYVENEPFDFWDAEATMVAEDVCYDATEWQDDDYERGMIILNRIR
jgi:hypothetical protein